MHGFLATFVVFVALLAFCLPSFARATVDRAAGSFAMPAGSPNAPAVVDLHGRDLSDYDYRQKKQFKTAARARLGDVERGVNGLKTRMSIGARVNGSRLAERIDQLGEEQAETKTRLSQADRVPETSWDSFRERYDRDVQRLEDELHRIQTTMR